MAYRCSIATSLLALTTGATIHAQSVTVILANENFNQVWVEAQIEGGASFDPKLLTKTATWPISCPKGRAVLYRSREEPNSWGEWIRASCGYDYTYRISDGGRLGGCQGRTIGANSDAFVNANNAVRVSGASIEISPNCEARLRFTSASVNPGLIFPDPEHAPTVF